MDEAADRLRRKLEGDKAGKWLEVFGDQLPDLCQRMVDECKALGIDSEPLIDEGDDFSTAFDIIFEGAILNDDDDRADRIDWLRSVEAECRKARGILCLPATDLKL